MDSLPIEVLKEVFQYISTTDLLHKCRIVSKLWKEVGSLCCRQRRVSFKGGLEYETIPVCIFETFQDVGNLPWSSISLNLYTGYQSARISNQISQRYGYKIKSITIYVSSGFIFGNPLDLLLHIPCLENLKIVQKRTKVPDLGAISTEQTLANDAPPHPSEFAVNDDGKSFLANLKRFEVRFESEDEDYAHSVEFMEFLVLNCSRMVSIHVTLYDFVQEAYLIKILQIMSALDHNIIKDLFVALIYTGSPSLANSIAIAVSSQELNLKINELRITYDRRQREMLQDGHFTALEQFVSSCKFLKTLNVIGFSSTQQIPDHNLLELPSIPNLQILQIIFVKPSISNQIIYFRPFRPNQFPSLRTFSIRLYPDTRPVIDVDIGKILTTTDNNDEETKFESVNAVQLHNCNAAESGIENWLNMFPNATTLNVTITTKNCEIPDICNSYGEKLQKLYISFLSGSNPNTILAEAFCPGRDLRGLTKLKKLRILGMPLDNNECPLGDVGAVVLGLLHPLDLIITNAVLSDACISLLRHRHRRFQLL